MHRSVLIILGKMRNRLYVPDAAILEFEITLASLGGSPGQIRDALAGSEEDPHIG